MNDVISQQLGVIAPSFTYDGSGIRVGVISAESRTYISGTLSLEGTSITALTSLFPPAQASHPTAVMSEISGQSVVADNTVFRGVAPSAELFIAPVRASNGVLTAIERMAQLGVKVINFSAGIINSGYSEFDLKIDELIAEHDILFVTVSGNERTLTSPGRAKNAIAVGNLSTKNFPDIPLVKPWRVWCESEDNCSGFSESGVHKPDIVAPGAWVGYAETPYSINYDNFGTSFAAPWVSGTAALIYQVIGTSRSYLAVKAILLMAADSGSVSTDGDPRISEHIRLRSGYGMLDIENAVKIAEAAMIFEGRLENQISLPLPEGIADIMLVFEKGTDGVALSVGNTHYHSGEQNTVLIKNTQASHLTLFGNGERYAVVVRYW